MSRRFIVTTILNDILGGGDETDIKKMNQLTGLRPGHTNTVLKLNFYFGDDESEGRSSIFWPGGPRSCWIASIGSFYSILWFITLTYKSSSTEQQAVL